MFAMVVHRLDGILADGRLGGEHHRGGSVEDRVCDVGGLRARRLRPVHHRLEHLGRGDRRLPALERGEDDPLLQERNLRGADLDAEIAPGDHHRVGLVEDVLESPSPRP